MEQLAISDYLTTGSGRLFISGAYVATDLGGTGSTVTDSDREFLRTVLKCDWVTNNGSKTNNVVPVEDSRFEEIGEFHFSAGLGENGVYGVELPDSLKPAKDSGAQTQIRYDDAKFNAAIAYGGTDYRVVVFGFPFETITSAEIRHKVMNTILEMLVSN
jgi:hypothetical protein